MVGRLLSFADGLLSGAMLASGGVCVSITDHDLIAETHMDFSRFGEFYRIHATGMLFMIQQKCVIHVDKHTCNIQVDPIGIMSHGSSVGRYTTCDPSVSEWD